MKLSIITICLNDLQGLSKTCESINSQDFNDFEHIIIDGGSWDGTLEFLQNSMKDFRKYISEKDSGIYNAMNKGIKMAKGDYCLFLNSGDYLVDYDVLKSVFAKGYSEDIIYGNMIIQGDNTIHRVGKMPKKISTYQMITDTIWHPVSFIKRELFARYSNYDESFTIAGDYDFFVKVICRFGVSTRYINKTISVFILDGISSAEKNKEIVKSERELVQKKYFSKKEMEKAIKWKKINSLFLIRVINKFIS